ncbi:hypothetical protein G3480_17285 [Thiorhodococcus mannitoliphagus]|uniref:Uncharacterized protein n=1 Tax=Thiorhodococcus mannitoliphagus TaxID=329406 RepID=A0A6P1DVA3_9GAMM|nr:hypothetical protein [Thiorhodococcus mannitoliphagus]NEX22038.1 hypothetical protein [Thiorhodococcus mannitoliphagus]
MRLSRPAWPLAAGFFLVWLCVLYLGADHPPPLGFAWLVLLDLVAALLVYRRVPTYVDWHAARWPHRGLRVLCDGALIGLVFGTATLLLSVARLGRALPLDWEPVFTWLLVLTLVGAANSALLYAFIAGG